MTSERVRWIGKLRDNISTFAGLIHYWVAGGVEDTAESNNVLREIDKLRYLIKLQLNPSGDYDTKIIDKINEIPNLTHQPDKSLLWNSIDELINDTQGLLKDEWEKVKKEVQNGALS